MRKIITALLLVGCGSVQAVPVTWDVFRIMSEQGTYVRGQFTYDADTNTYSDISIYWTSRLHSGTVTTADLDLSSASSTYMEFIPSGKLDQLYWYFQPEALSNVDVGVTVDYRNGTVKDFEGRIGGVRGTAKSVVPIPAAAWLFGSALAGLGWIRRRQTA